VHDPGDWCQNKSAQIHTSWYKRERILGLIRHEDAKGMLIKQSFIGFDKFVFKHIFDAVGFARVFKLSKGCRMWLQGWPWDSEGSIVNSWSSKGSIRWYWSWTWEGLTRGMWWYTSRWRITSFLKFQNTPGPKPEICVLGWLFPEFSLTISIPWPQEHHCWQD